MTKIFDRDKLTQIFSLGIGKSGLDDEKCIIEGAMRKQYAMKSIDKISCPECKCIVFDTYCPIYQNLMYCWNCGQLVKR